MKSDLKQIIDQLKDLNEQTHRGLVTTLNQFDKKAHPVNSFEFVSYKLINRFSVLVKSSNLFMDNLKEDTSFEFQIGLLLRPALLDILAYAYITDDLTKKWHETQKLDWTLLKPRFENCLADNLIRYKKEVDLFFADNFINDIDRKNIVNFLTRISTNAFGKNILCGSEHYTFPPASRLYNEIKTSVTSKKYAPVYYLYSHYSKYEHFGIITTIMDDEKVNSLDDISFRLVQSFGFINKTIIVALLFLGLDSTEMLNIEKVYNRIIEEVAQNMGV